MIRAYYRSRIRHQLCKVYEIEKKMNEVENRKRKSPANCKWTDEFTITAYELAREGLTEPQMARVMGISTETFRNWERTKPLFSTAVQRGRAFLRATGVSMEDFRDDIYSNLSPEEKETWNKLHQLNLLRSDRKKIDLLFEHGGRTLRQKMFLCAMLKCRFNQAAACRMTGIAMPTVQLWRKTDPAFWKMMSAIEQTEKEWAKSCVRSLAQDNPVVAIYVNRCLNGNDGWDDRTINVNVKGQIEHTHTHKLVAFDDLELDHRTELSVLNALRQKRKLIESKEVKAEAV